MEKIKIRKRCTGPERNYSVACRVSFDLSKRLDELGEKTGYTKRELIDLLLERALDAVEIIDNDK